MSTGTNTVADGDTPSASNLGCYIVPCSQIFRNNSPVSSTTHNLMITPSALGFASALETDINVNTGAGATAQANAVFENVAVSVWCANTGSGAQAIYVSMLYGGAILNAAKVNEVRS